jgi:hypothetical protein
MRAFICLCAALFIVACDTPAATPTAPPAQVAKPSPSDARVPSPAEERAIVDGLARGGARVTAIAPTKFDWLFGSSAPRSAVFSVTVDGSAAWADVHFLAAPLNGLSSCSETLPGRETTFTVRANGQLQATGGSVTGSLGAVTPMYFLADDRYFVMTPHAALRDVLRSVFGLSAPPC